LGALAVATDANSSPRQSQVRMLKTSGYWVSGKPCAHGASKGGNFRPGLVQVAETDNGRP
jgi:hypothetical protein